MRAGLTPTTMSILGVIATNGPTGIGRRFNNGNDSWKAGIKRLRSEESWISTSSSIINLASIDFSSKSILRTGVRLNETVPFTKTLPNLSSKTTSTKSYENSNPGVDILETPLGADSDN